MSLKIYSSNSNEVVFVQPDADNKISVAELKNKFGKNVVALEVLTNFNKKQRITPRKTGYFCRKHGWSISVFKVTAIFGPLPQPNLILYLNSYDNGIPITKKGTISLKNVEKCFQKNVAALEFTQGSSKFLLKPKTKKKCFKLPNLQWQEPFTVEPTYRDIRETVQVHADNGKSVTVPLLQNGDLKLNNELFGREVQVLHITYKNTVYRQHPVTKNVFKQPYCSWKKCDYINAILVKPVLRESVVSYGSISDEDQWDESSLINTTYYIDHERYGWNGSDRSYHANEKSHSKRCSWKLLFFITVLVLLLIGGIMYVWRAEIRSQLMLFANSLPQIRDKIESGWSTVKLFVADKMRYLGTLF